LATPAIGLSKNDGTFQALVRFDEAKKSIYTAWPHDQYATSPNDLNPSFMSRVLGYFKPVGRNNTAFKLWECAVISQRREDVWAFMEHIAILPKDLPTPNTSVRPDVSRNKGIAKEYHVDLSIPMGVLEHLPPQGYLVALAMKTYAREHANPIKEHEVAALMQREVNEGRLVTRQDPMRIFLYYRARLQTIGLIAGLRQKC